MDGMAKPRLGTWAAVGCVAVMLAAGCSESAGPTASHPPTATVVVVPDVPYEGPIPAATALTLEEVAPLVWVSNDQLNSLGSYRFRSEVHLTGADSSEVVVLDGAVEVSSQASHLRLLEPDNGEGQIVIGDRVWTGDQAAWEEQSPDDRWGLTLLGPHVNYFTAREAAGGLLQGEVTVVGSEEVHGRPTLHVRGKPRPSNDLFEDGLSTGDLWIDQTGIVIRGRWVIDSPSGPESAEWTWELFDLGAPITIEPPQEPPVGDRGAQASLRTALTAAKVYYVDWESYEAAPTDLADIEPSINFTNQFPFITPGVVGYVATPTQMLLITTTDNDTWFCISDNISSGVGYGTGNTLQDVDSFDECRDPAW